MYISTEIIIVLAAVALFGDFDMAIVIVIVLLISKCFLG